MMHSVLKVTKNVSPKLILLKVGTMHFTVLMNLARKFKYFFENKLSSLRSLCRKNETLKVNFKHRVFNVMVKLVEKLHLSIALLDAINERR